MLRTPRLILRAARPDDLPAIHAVMSDPVAMRYWSTPPHSTLAESEAWLTSMIDGERNGTMDFIVEYEGRAIGKMGAWKAPEFGYILAREHWGKGLASEALQAYLAYAIPAYVPQLFADVDPRNAASIRLLERNGFVIFDRAERTWNVGGEWCDSVYLRYPEAIEPDKAGDTVVRLAE